MDLTGPYIRVASGAKFYFLAPGASPIRMSDIAHSLARQCRFNGHVDRHYSVAQHCIAASYACPTHPLEALMHDAAEAYTGDIVSPLKSVLPSLAAIESGIESAICKEFGVQYPFPDEVWEADNAVLCVEFLELPPLRKYPCFEGEVPKEISGTVFRIVQGHMAAEEAEVLFLQRFEELHAEAR